MSVSIKKILICLAVLACLTAVPAHARLTVGLVGDQFGVWGRVGTPEFRTNLDAAYQALGRGVAALNRAGEMDVALHLGDFTESGRSDELRARDFARGAALMDELDSQSRPKWFLTPGDHDVNPLEWVQNSQDRSKEKSFQKLLLPHIPQVGKRLYYSFDVQGYHFVSLYSHDQLRSDPRWGNIFLARVGQEQLAWLEADLRKADTSKGVIVFTHQPLWYNEASWQPVHELLAKYNTRLVIAGHYHYDQIDRVLDGIQYRVVGAVGGHVKEGNARAGGWWHVTRLVIEDDWTTSWELIPVGEKRKTEFSNRYDMDRVQALTVMLGSAVRQLEGSSLYAKDGRLTDAQGNPSVKLALKAMGNPVDVPVKLEIAILPDPVFEVRRAAFTPGTCINENPTTMGWLHPSANIASSNYSTAKPACARYARDYSACLEYKTLWDAEIQSVPGREIHVGETVMVRLKVTYAPRNGGEEMQMWKTARVPVKALP